MASSEKILLRMRSEPANVRFSELVRVCTESALAEKNYSGEFRVRIPPLVHRALAMQAAEQGISLNRLASAKLAG